MMTARELIDEANQNLGLKKVGIEIELLVLKEVGREFKSLARKLGISVGRDGTVEPRDEGPELAYRPYEIDFGKRPWTQLERSFNELTAWLRRSVPVAVGYGAKKILLPRGKTPQNMTAGLHLHFDLGWFDNVEHVRRFIQNFNSFSKEDLKGMVAHSRYHTRQKHEPFSSGQQFAQVFKHKVPTDRDIETFKSVKGTCFSNEMGKNSRTITIDPERLDHFLIWWGEIAGRSRYSALNIHAVCDHNTVEFRFPNATLSFSSISGWVEFIAELIDASREKTYSQFKWASRRGDMKHIGQFMDRRKEAHGHSPRVFPWEKDWYEPPRSYNRLGL